MAYKNPNDGDTQVSILKVICASILALYVAHMGGGAISTRTIAATEITIGHIAITSTSVGVILVAISCLLLYAVFKTLKRNGAGGRPR